MRESEHFNLFLAEGSDIVNPLVQDVQNYESIDEQMFKNRNAGVQNATELKSGTVHAITRNVPDAQFITFTATSNYTAGETFTVDGIQVTALTVGGETLPTGAYVINSQVLCVLKGTLLTVYGVGSEVADNSLALNGHPDTYFGTKKDVDNAINTSNAANELVNEINTNLNGMRFIAYSDDTTVNGYATSASLVSDVKFSTPLNNAKYIVIPVFQAIATMSAVNVLIVNKTTTGFRIRIDAPNGTFSRGDSYNVAWIMFGYTL